MPGIGRIGKIQGNDPGPQAIAFLSRIEQSGMEIVFKAIGSGRFTRIFRLSFAHFRLLSMQSQGPSDATKIQQVRMPFDPGWFMPDQ